MQDYVLTEKALGLDLTDLTLTSVRPFKINHGGTSGAYIGSLSKQGYQRITFETPEFYSAGVKDSSQYGYSNLHITCGKDACGWLETMYTKVMKHLYPHLLTAIERIQRSEQAQGRSLNEMLASILNGGPLAIDKYVQDIWKGRIAYFLKVMPEALVFTQASDNGIIEGRPTIEIAYDKTRTPAGMYKARVVLRYLFIDLVKGTPNVKLVMQADQLYHTPIEYKCPTAPVMDTSFFTPKATLDTLIDDLMMEELETPMDYETTQAPAEQQPPVKQQKPKTSRAKKANPVEIEVTIGPEEVTEKPSAKKHKRDKTISSL